MITTAIDTPSAIQNHSAQDTTTIFEITRVMCNIPIIANVDMDITEMEENAKEEVDIACNVTEFLT